LLSDNYTLVLSSKVKTLPAGRDADSNSAWTTNFNFKFYELRRI